MYIYIIYVNIYQTTQQTNTNKVRKLQYLIHYILWRHKYL